MGRRLQLRHQKTHRRLELCVGDRGASDDEVNTLGDEHKLLSADAFLRALYLATSTRLAC